MVHKEKEIKGYKIKEKYIIKLYKLYEEVKIEKEKLNDESNNKCR